MWAQGCFTLAQSTLPSTRPQVQGPAADRQIEVTVLKDFNGKPIENAKVICHTLNDPGNMELKSNEDGKAVIDVLPIGDTVRLQIIAKGFQTYGQDYKVDKDEMAIEVRMKRPGEQYSIYKDHAEATRRATPGGPRATRTNPPEELQAAVAESVAQLFSFIPVLRSTVPPCPCLRPASDQWTNPDPLSIHQLISE